MKETVIQEALFLTKKINLAYPSSNGIDKIFGTAWYPDTEPIAILQISHGMAEHIERYQDFAHFLNTLNILVVGNDHLGHGRSARSTELYGYFAEEDADQHVINDIKQLHDYFAHKHPSIPYFLLGHSMGSFIVRNYVQQFGKEHLNGTIFMGTSGPNALGSVELQIVKALAHQNPMKTNPHVDKLAFGSFNKHFPEQRTGFDWLTRDTKVVDWFIEQEDTGFIFTNNGFKTLLTLQQNATKKGWTDTIPKELPVLVISGESDPVGQYGKGVMKVFKQLERVGLEDVTYVSYTNMRHEILMELGKEQVYEDVSDWLLKRI